MKKLLFLTSLFPLMVFGQTNPVVLNLFPPRQNFLPGQASYTDTTNEATSLTNIDGYIYPSNFTGITRFAFPPRFITGSNVQIALRVLTTNINSAVVGTYHLVLYTNNVTTPFWDSGEVTNFGVKPLFTNNIMALVSTNVITNSLTSNTMVYGSIYFKLGPYTTNWAAATEWDTEWLLGGHIQFP